MKSINNIVIIGSGQLGVRIQGLLAKAGLSVVPLGLKLDSTGALAGADLLIEAIGGDLVQSGGLMQECAEKIPPESILATTASSGITEMAALTGRPQNFTGLSFTFNPFKEGCLAQITRGLETTAETISACRDLMERAGVTAIEVADSPGLVVDRVMALTINEAAIMLMTKVAAVEDIDGVARSCLNWPAGPFQFADIIGIDNVLDTLEVLSREVGSRFLPSSLLKQMVAAGRLGKKTGRGFYIYS